MYHVHVIVVYTSYQVIKLYYCSSVAVLVPSSAVARYDTLVWISVLFALLAAQEVGEMTTNLTTAACFTRSNPGC